MIQEFNFWKKRLLNITVLFFLLGNGQFAQGQFWVQKAGGITIDEAYDIAVTSGGDAYTTGYFTGTASFGSVSLSSSGSTDIFVTKNDNNGNFLWAVKAGGTGSDRGLSIKVDNNGNCYVTGYFNGTATFGSTTLISSGLQDIFIAKYSTAGALLWVKKAGGVLADVGFGIAVDANGDVFVTGSFKSSATFGSTILVAANSTSDVFTTKLNSSGVFQWTKSGTGNYSNRGVDIGVDNTGNVYVTGQFSDTITFGSVHPNQMQSVIFLIKYNSSGTEQWFRIIGGGVTNITYGIAVDGTGNSFLTGDFTGTLTFYGTPNVTLSNPFTNKIFIAKYNSSGSVQWTHADGSDSDFNARSININNSGSCWVTGFFSCKLDEYSNSYGPGTFNAVGGFDIFVTKIHSSGSWAYSRNMGGRNNDKSYGIAVNSSGQIHIAGSFDGSLFVPTSTNFLAPNLALWTDVSCSGNSPYCNDFDYGSFHSVSSSGNLDAVIGRSFDDNREPFDYYLRSGVVSQCQKPQSPVQIGLVGQDTITACNEGLLIPIGPFCTSIGPQYSYSWSSGVIPIGGSQSVKVTMSGTYSVTLTSSDGCFVSEDSIYVDVLTTNDTIRISDDHGFNTNAIIPAAIEACNPDTVEVWASGISTISNYWWTGGTLPINGLYDTIFTTSTDGAFYFHWISSAGCEDSTLVLVAFHDSLPPYPLKLHLADSDSICEGEIFRAQLYDSISNPFIQPICFVEPTFNIITTWTITPTTTQNTSCGTFGFFSPTTSGWYTVSAEFVRENYCYTDTVVLTDSIYVHVNPTPVVPPFSITISGGPNLCPGDTLQLEANGAPNYTWLGPNVNGITDSIIQVTSSGVYNVGSILNDTNMFGCVGSFDTVASTNISLKPQPIITTNSIVICPGDSVLLSSNAGSGNNWEGPNGPISSTLNYIYVTDPGVYFTVVNDADSCGLVSNGILLSQYTTPQLMATGDTILCDGDSTTITAQAGDSSIIEWQPPLSGSNPTQVIYAAGTYTVKITSCGIETYASITIHPASALASISASGVLCEDSTIILSASPGMVSYLWMPGGQTTAAIPVSSSGMFTVSILDTNGCSATSDTFNVDQIFVPASITSSAQGFCFGDSMVLIGNPNMTAYQWDPTGETTQSIVTYLPGIFTLSVTDTNGCIGVSNDVEIIMPDTIATINLLGADYFCEGDSVEIDATNPMVATYEWFPNNEQTPTITVYQTGIFSVTTIDTFGCTAYSDTVNVRVDSNSLEIPRISNDTSICSGTSITLVATADSGKIVWYNPMGDPAVFTGSMYNVKVIDDTRFYVRTESEVCVSEPANVLVETFDCEAVNAPNIFTPNGDGVNDYFQVIILGTSYFKVQIYNRWGTLIYTLDHPNQRWDGTMYESGEALSDGTYYFVVNYGKYDGTDASEKGYITLMR